jgi:hypothetical protein
MAEVNERAIEQASPPGQQSDNLTVQTSTVV